MLEESLQFLQDNIGAAYEITVIPSFVDGSIVYTASLSDEYGECVGVEADTLLGAVNKLAADFRLWLDEQSTDEPILMMW
jgi:hypothetical protein